MVKRVVAAAALGVAAAAMAVPAKEISSATDFAILDEDTRDSMGDDVVLCRQEELAVQEFFQEFEAEDDGALFARRARVGISNPLRAAYDA